MNPRLAAEVTVMLKHNGIHLSLSSLLKIFSEDTLFESAGGGFRVPALTTFKEHVHRDIWVAIQRTLDESRTGYSADRLIDREALDGKTTGYRIKGKVEFDRR
jgi:hypothetical protein